MTAAAVCPHGMGSPASCIDCMDDVGLGPEPPAPRPVEAPDARPMRARRDSDCPGCGGDIYQGQWIIRMTDGTYRHHGHGCSR